MEPALHLGTCSWKFKAWRGLVYSGATPSLQEYATHYDCVEIDQWFYSLFTAKVVLPDSKVVADYSASVPAGFKFAVKLPNSLTLTHYPQSTEPNPHFLSPDLLQAFLERLQPLQPFLGPLMFQFGYLNADMMPTQQMFHKKLDALIRQLPHSYQWCVETRNPNYLNAPYFAFLRERNLAHVWQQGYYMPPIFDLYAQHADQLTDTVVMRFHGKDRDGMEAKAGANWSQLIDPHDAELDAVAGMLKDLKARKRKAWVLVNNHYEGSAPLTIERIKTRLAGPMAEPTEPIRCTQVQYGSPEYAATVALRNDVLRKPLGLLFSDQQLQDESRDHHLACFKNGQIVACLVLTPLSDSMVRMRQVAVTPDCQRQGLGKALVLYAERYAAGLGFAEIMAHARESALPFYAKLGYTHVGGQFVEVGIPHREVRKRLVSA